MTPSLKNSNYKSKITTIPTCNGEFLYDIEKPWRIKLRIRYNDGAPTTWEDKPSSNSQWTDPQWIYDFGNERRGDDTLEDGSSDGSLDNFSITADDTTPTTAQYIDLTVKARDSNNDIVTDYTDTVNFKVYYRTSSSSSWTQTISSTYYTMNASYIDGYDFPSANKGVKTFINFIKFKKNNYDYKVRVYDENDSSIYKEISFTVGNTSATYVDGFTSSQLATVNNIYDARDAMILKLKNLYGQLRNNISRLHMSDDLKTAMKEIIDDDSEKTYDNFTDFNTAFLSWYTFTVANR